jgi:hypothetical protein
MATISLYQNFTVELDGRTVRGGSHVVATSIAIADNEIYDQTFKLAAQTATKIWDKTVNAAMGDFDFLWLESDRDVLVQFTTDAGGDDEYFVKELKGSGSAGIMGPALVLGSDLAHQFDGTVDAFDGTEDTIDEIWVYSEHATNTPRVRLFAAT